MNLIEGKILSLTGPPVAGASVFISQASVSVQDIAQLSNEQGEFLISVPSEGEYTIQAAAPGFESASVTVHITQQRASVTITLKQL